MGCLIMGDETAAAISQYRHECAVIVNQGASTHSWLNEHYRNKSLKDFSLSTVVISLGEHDEDFATASNNFKYLRYKLRGKRVIWIAPDKEARPFQYLNVLNIANEWGDQVIVKKGKTYEAIAQQTK